MAADPQQLLDKITADNGALERRKAAIDAKLGQIVPELTKAIDKTDGPQLETFSAALEHELALIEDGLEAARQIGTQLRELGQHKAFVAANIERVGKAAQKLSALRDGLTKASETNHRLVDRAEVARKQSLAGADHAQRGLAQLRRWLRQDSERAQATLTRAEAIQLRASAAAASRDDDALEAAQKDFDLLTIAVTQEAPARNRKRIGDWAQATLGKGLGEAQDGALRAEAGELLDKVAEMDNRFVAPLAKIEAKVMPLVIPEIDARKAADAIGIDIGLSGKLDKVLNRTPLPKLEKALDDFGRASRVDLKGKAAVATLRRAGLLR